MNHGLEEGRESKEQVYTHRALHLVDESSEWRSKGELIRNALFRFVLKERPKRILSPKGSIGVCDLDMSLDYRHSTSARKGSSFVFVDDDDVHYR